MAIKVGQLRKDLVGESSCLEDIKSKISLTTFQKENSEFSDIALAGAWDTHDENNPKYNNTYYVKLRIKRINIYNDMGNGGDNDPHNLTIDVKLYKDASIKNQYQTIRDAIYIEPHIPEDGSNSDYAKEEAFLAWCEEHLDPSELELPDGTEMLLPAQMVGYNYVSNSSSILIEEEDAPDSRVIEYYNELNQKFKEKTQNIDASQGHTNSEYEIVELVFSPYVASTLLALELRRVAYDYVNEEPREIEIDWDGSEFYKIKNVLPIGVMAKKVGIQAKPGSLVVVNSAPMRVGKSGTLEIDVGIDITSIGFAAAGGYDAIDDFIVDYIYEA